MGVGGLKELGENWGMCGEDLEKPSDGPLTLQDSGGTEYRWLIGKIW